jgi:hypothetical protein
MFHDRILRKDRIHRDLAIGLAAMLVASPILDVLTGSSRIDSVLTTGFLIFALYQISRKASDLVIGLGLGLPAVAGGVVNAATPDTPAVNLLPVVLSGIFTAYLIWRILRDVFSGDRISSEQVFGAVSAYLLMGFLFASVYSFIVLVDPDAFLFSDALIAEFAASGGDRGFGYFSYFSFVTMSTLGYGDITPISAAARTFAWIQAVLGQLYLAITIAALVGTHISKRSS